MKGVRIMQKVLIRLDTEKIINEKKYALNNFHKTLHDFFDQFNFLQIQDSSDCIILEGKNHPHDFAHFGIIFNTLKKQPWFIDNITEWILYDNDDSDDPDIFDEEDLLQNFKIKQLAGG